MYVYLVLGMIAFAAIALAVRFLAGGLRVVAIVGALAIFAGLSVLAVQTGSGQKVPAAATQPTSTTSTVPAECATWKRVDSDKTDNRWFYDGIAEIKSARSTEDARNAAHVWSLRVRQDPVIFSGAIKSLLKRDVQPSELFDSNECATSAAVSLFAETEVELALASVTVGEAPSNGFNSGVSNGRVVSASQPGITGDRKAIKVVLKDGTTVWILGRCGQITVLIVPPFPPGPTDEQPTATTTSTTSRVTTTTQRSTTSTTSRVTTTTQQSGTTTTTVRATTTTLKSVTPDCRLNPNNPGCPTPPIGNPPQDNSTSGVNTGPTPGAPVVAPAPSAPGPTPVPNTPAPAPLDPSTGGPPSYDSGSGTGSGTPGGSVCGTSCSGGGPTPAAPGTPPVVDSGTYTTDDGGF